MALCLPTLPPHSTHPSEVARVGEELESRVVTPQTDAAAGALEPSELHVLLVDDEQLSRLVVGNLLRKCNYKVTVVESGSQALDILRRSLPGTFQLILTDVMMPEVSGLELLRFVRANEDLANLPVIMMSANEHQHMVFEAIKGGAEEYLVKPVTRKEVQNIWQYVWKRIAAVQANRGAEAEAQAHSSSSPPDDAATGRQRQQSCVEQPQPQQQPQQQQQQQQLGQMDAAAVRQSCAASTSSPTPQRQHRQPRQQQQQHQQPRQQHSPPQQQQLQQQQQGRQRPAPRPGRTDKVPLSRWLLRPGRAVDPKESVWIFCEVLLLLEGLQQELGPGARLPAGMVRPAKLLLHSDGRVSFATLGCDGGGDASGAAAATANEEELLYRSPEEAAAAAAAHGVKPEGSSPEAVQKALVFSLGMLFFELFHAPGSAAGNGAAPGPSANGSAAAAAAAAATAEAVAAARQRALSDLRQRILPPAFLRHRPQEAALTLALLHPDPAARPSVAELAGGELLGGYCEALRARHRQMAAAAAAEQAASPDAESLLYFLRTLQQRKEEEVTRVAADLNALDSQIGSVAARLACVRGPAFGLQRSASAGANAAGMAAAAAAAPGLAAPSAAAAARAGSSAAAVAAVAAAASAAAVADGAGDTGESPGLVGGRWGDAAAGKGAAVGGAHLGPQDNGSGGDGEGDDAEEGHHRRHKRQRLGPATAEQPAATTINAAAGTSAVATSNGAAAAAGADAAAGVNTGAVGGLPPSLAAKWAKVLESFPALESAFFKRKQQAERSLAGAQHPAANASQSPPPPQQQQQQQQHSLTQRAAAHHSNQSPAATAAGGTAVGGATSVPMADYLLTFSEDLSAFTRYSRFAVRASLRHGDPLGPCHMVCSASFDRDDEFFATAGVSKRIRIYEYARVLDPVVDSHYPLLEISSRSRLSSVAWSGYVKSHLASSDYEGVVQLWDANTNTELMQFEEHAKRVWCVDFSSVDPTRLVSASDDGTVRLWSIHQECSVATIDTRANVCCVQFSPDSSHLIALGSANSRIYLYDLRSASSPLAVVPGHAKAVSYVRFLSGSQLVSASTDSTLRLWGVPAMASGDPEACELVLRGHANEKNFVGLSITNDGYIACGSETNHVHAYYKSMPMPITSHDMAAGAQTRGVSGGLASEMADGGPSKFVSCVCWSRRHGTLLAANSAGNIQVLELQ